MGIYQLYIDSDKDELRLIMNESNNITDIATVSLIPLRDTEGNIVTDDKGKVKYDFSRLEYADIVKVLSRINGKSVDYVKQHEKDIFDGVTIKAEDLGLGEVESITPASKELTEKAKTKKSSVLKKIAYAVAIASMAGLAAFGIKSCMDKNLSNEDEAIIQPLPEKPSKPTVENKNPNTVNTSTSTVETSKVEKTETSNNDTKEQTTTTIDVEKELEVAKSEEENYIKITAEHLEMMADECYKDLIANGTIVNGNLTYGEIYKYVALVNLETIKKDSPELAKELFGETNYVEQVTIAFKVQDAIMTKDQINFREAMKDSNNEKAINTFIDTQMFDMTRYIWDINQRDQVSIINIFNKEIAQAHRLNDTARVNELVSNLIKYVSGRYDAELYGETIAKASFNDCVMLGMVPNVCFSSQLDSVNLKYVNSSKVDKDSTTTTLGSFLSGEAYLSNVKALVNGCKDIEVQNNYNK